jgi:hypothetical protein
VGSGVRGGVLCEDGGNVKLKVNFLHYIENNPLGYSRDKTVQVHTLDILPYIFRHSRLNYMYSTSPESCDVDLSNSIYYISPCALVPEIH